MRIVNTPSQSIDVSPERSGVRGSWRWRVKYKITIENATIGTSYDQ
jgi:hypothetical protein